MCFQPCLLEINAWFVVVHRYILIFSADWALWITMPFFGYLSIHHGFLHFHHHLSSARANSHSLVSSLTYNSKW
ncbi:hypothetical protein BDR05DRAFT_540110 [Suillus weaverae]|nr:hypothetical protein BDR05DRAFT_540110 [Suillus weaverae]